MAVKKQERIDIGTVELMEGTFTANYQPERKRVKLEGATSIAIFDMGTKSNYGYIAIGASWTQFHAVAKNHRFTDSDAAVIRFAVACALEASQKPQA